MPTPDELDRAANRRGRVLELIRESVNVRGYPPTVSELAVAVEVTKRQIRTDLAMLERAGAIQRDPGVTRGIRVVDRAAS